MATREDYTKCMTPYMKGTGRSNTERQADMCIGAKLCSGKAGNKQQAAQLCAEAASKPKPPKKSKKTKKFCFNDFESLSVCMAANIDVSKLTSDNMQQVFANALAACSGAQAKTKIKKAASTIEQLDPEDRVALQTIAKLSKQFEGKKW